METGDFPESDWKIFRALREVALERFCNRVLAEVEALCRDPSRSHHKRYLDLCRLLRERDKELAYSFDDPRRSAMILQLAAIHASGLLEPDELARCVTAHPARTAAAHTATTGNNGAVAPALSHRVDPHRLLRQSTRGPCLETTYACTGPHFVHFRSPLRVPCAMSFRRM